jgi:hypothetical protein
MLRLLGFSEERLARLLDDYRRSDLSAADIALIDVGLDPNAPSDPLVSEAARLEAAQVAAAGDALCTLADRLGVAPDFAPVEIPAGGRQGGPPVPQKIVHPSPPEARPIVEAPSGDPDAECVDRVCRGDLSAFEELMNRHSRRVYRTLVGILGDPDEARDAMQDTFLKVFQHLGTFQRRSKFSTWLVTIAGNTGIQILREKRRFESLEWDADSDTAFRPRQVQAWSATSSSSRPKTPPPRSASAFPR